MLQDDAEGGGGVALKDLDDILSESIRRNGESLVAVLQDIQEHYNYLPERALRSLSRKTGVPLIDIYRVATFYNSFSLVPRGKHQIVVCAGTTCHVRGASKVTEEISRVLGIGPGQVSADGNFSLDTVNCLGCCAFAPVMVVDGEYHGNLTPAKTRKILTSLKAKWLLPAGEADERGLVDDGDAEETEGA
ncbi:MAG TPA: NAD(P)H-dependent oxidoreductase subunit E [Clostridia bacterium]|nr:NAD(P)H-dependent oxidoreductase subunit E [Clostridia bacterium]